MRFVIDCHTDAKKKNFTAKDADGKRYTWKYWRRAGWWMLEDPHGYVRTLEKTWRDSLPHFHLILENHGLTANIS